MSMAVAVQNVWAVPFVVASRTKCAKCGREIRPGMAFLTGRVSSMSVVCRECQKHRA